jgi:phage-related protein
VHSSLLPRTVAVLGVFFFRTDAGNEPVLDWLRALAADDGRIIGEDLRMVQIGWPLGMTLCRSLGDGLYEVRSSITGNRITRLVFFQHGDDLIVVEGFIKKSKATPDDVLKLAKRRRSDFLRHEAEKKR